MGIRPVGSVGLSDFRTNRLLQIKLKIQKLQADFGFLNTLGITTYLPNYPKNFSPVAKKLAELLSVKKL